MQGRRIVVPGPRQVTLETFDVDDSPLRPNEAMVRTRYTTISPGTELAIYTAVDPGVYDQKAWGHYPFQPGYIAVGEVIACGIAGKRRGDRKRCREGDLIFWFGTHASVQRVNLAGFMLPVPPDFDLSQVGLTRMATVAMTAVRQSTAAAGDVVVVIGQGLVGNLAAQLFTLSGIATIAVDVSDRRLALSSRCGVPHVVNPAREDLLARVRELTDGRGAHTVVEAIGDSRLIAQAPDIVARHGEVILLGTPRAPFQTDMTPFFRHVHMRGVTIKGALEWLYPTMRSDDARFTIEDNARYVFQLFHQGRILFAPLLTHILAPEAFQRGYEGLLEEKDAYLGVAINWAD